MTPAGVEVRFRDGTRREFHDEGEHIYRYRLELGWAHVTCLTGEGNAGTPRFLEVESYPSERIDLISHIYRTTS